MLGDARQSRGERERLHPSERVLQGVQEQEQEAAVEIHGAGHVASRTSRIFRRRRSRRRSSMISPFIMLARMLRRRSTHPAPLHRAPAPADPARQPLGDQHGDARAPRRADRRGRWRSPDPSRTSWAVTPGTSSGSPSSLPSSSQPSSAIATCSLAGAFHRARDAVVLGAAAARWPGRGPASPWPSAARNRQNGLEAAVEGRHLFPAGDEDRAQGEVDLVTIAAGRGPRARAPRRGPRTS